MNRRSLTALVVFLCFVFFGYINFHISHGQTAVTTISGKFYRLEVLATNGMSGITTINSSSINDFGTVAFNSTGAGSGLFTADGRTPLRNIAGGNIRAPQITNNNHVVFRSQAGAGLSTGTLVRRDTNLSGSPETVIAGESATAFPDFQVIGDFPSINNNIQAAFSVLSTTSQIRTSWGKYSCSRNPHRF